MTTNHGVGGSNPSGCAIFLGANMLSSEGSKPWMLFIRSLILLLALSCVVYTTYKLKEQSHRISSPEGNQDQKLGQQDFQRQLRLSKASGAKLVWCRNRVRSLSLSQGHLREEKGRWLFQSSKERAQLLEIPYLKVEKWLASHCQITTQELVIKWDELSFQKQPLCATFVGQKGTKPTCFQSPPGSQAIFKWKNQVFHSKQLGGALTELQELLLQ